MDIKELDDVERYLIEQCNKGRQGSYSVWLEEFIRHRFAELRAREEAKKQG